MERKSYSSKNNNAHAAWAVGSRTRANDAQENVVLKGGKMDETRSSRLPVLQDLGNQLQLKAERMRLLARAEQGLADGDYNPYVTQTIVHAEQKDEIYSQDLRQLPEVVEPLSKIPVTSARQRHREKKAKPKKTSSVNIKQYRPGYTWNRGGRVRELRIRNLARKFLFIWKRKTFGRVTPSEASHHYNQKLLKLVFSEWHTQWWEARREWRLLVRAECHHRYVLWLKSFQAWKEYVMRRRVKNTKLAMAEQHGSCKLMRKCVDAWIVYTQSKKYKNQKKHFAEDHYSRTLQRSMWSRWRAEQDLMHHRQHMETVALQFWAYRVQAQHWLVWRERLSQRKAAILNQFKATRHSDIVVLKKCWKGCVQYWLERRRKKQEKASLRAMFERQLIVKMFQCWKEQYGMRRAMQEHQEKMMQLAERFQLRRAFVHWQHYVYLQHKKQLMIADAEDHYERKLMVAGLSGFRLCVIQRRLKTMRLELADQHRNKMLMLSAWNHWLSRCEDNEELKIISETRRARKHYRLTLQQKCFNQLQNYCSWRKLRQAQYARAEAHYYMHVMPQYLFRMKIFVQLIKNNRENGENAVAFRRENLQARYFYQWVNMYEFSKEYRMNERMAILHYDDTILKRFFISWKHKTTEALKEAENEEIAEAHYNVTLCRNHLMAWKSHIDELKASHRHEIVASRHYCERGLKRCLQAWKKYTESRRKKHRQTNKAVVHCNKVVCKKMLAMWLHYVDTQRVIKQQVEVKYVMKCRLLLSESFHRWRENVVLQKQEKEASRHAEKHHSHLLLTKILRTWHRYAAIHAYKKSETRQWVQSAAEEINTRKLRIYFTRWQIVHSETALDRLQCEKADHHHALRIKHAVIQIWKSFTKHSVRKKLLQKQSDWFYHVRLTAKYFIGWKHAHSEALVEKEKTNIALWHWCLSLHRKVLIGWFAYVQQRKHKKQRIADAMERRRCRLLKEGVTQWLLVADDLRAMRMKFAAQQQAKCAYEMSQLVLRIGLHWKHWAQKQVKSRGGPKPLSTKPISSKPTSGIAKSGVRAVSHFMSGPSLSAPVSARSEGQPATRSRSPVADLKAQVSAVSPARSTKSEYGRSQLRARPRRPDFLVESLKRAGLFCPSLSEQRIEPSVQEPAESHVVPNQIETETRDMDHVIERLNLSNLSGERSEAETLLFKSTPHSERDVEQTVENSGQLQQQHVYKHDSIVQLQTEDRKSQVVHSGLPVQIHVPKLLTPADFMSKQVPVRIPKSHVSLVPSHGQDTVGISANRQMLDYHSHSESQSVASTPRVLCQSAEHSHPLRETYTLPTGNVREVTPKNITPRGDNSGSTTTQEIQKEIIQIRNKLKNFDQKKKKLRTMQKHMKQLSDWLKEEEVKGHNSDDEDICNARQEVEELSSDVYELKKIVEEEKALCSHLVDRVKLLTTQLTVT